MNVKNQKLLNGTLLSNCITIRCIQSNRPNSHLKCKTDLNNILKSGHQPTENATLLNHQKLAKGAVI